MRIHFLAFSLCAVTLLGAAGPEKVALYASVGPELTHYDVDFDNASLSKRATVKCPASIQYVWPHPSKRYLYVAWSDGGPAGAAGAPTGGSRHGVTAFRVDSSGVLQQFGPTIALPSRPVHLTLDIPGTHVLVAHTIPSGLTVWNIAADGSLGSEVKQPAGLDMGVYAHQVRVDPSNKAVYLVTRGNGPTKDKPEDPGALKIFTYKDGLLANLASVAPGGGYGFQPRHLDFHPSKPWVYVSLERQNKLDVYLKQKDGNLSRKPIFTRDSLANPARSNAGQAAGTVHLHPDGKIVYQANRQSGTDGENTIAVYSINQSTGEPTLIQNIDTHGSSPRTFSLDPQARIMVAANQVPPPGGGPASMAVYRVRKDGKLDYVRKYDIEATNARSLFWMGLVPLP